MKIVNIIQLWATACLIVVLLFSQNSFAGKIEFRVNGSTDKLVGDLYKLKRTDRDKEGKAEKIINLSGITYIPALNLFYGIENGNDSAAPKIFVINDKFEIINKVKIKGFSKKSTTLIKGQQRDFEGITFIEMDGEVPIIGIVNEIGEFYIGPVEVDEKRLTREELHRVVFNNGKDKRRKVKDNKGPEGVAYDSKTRTVYVAVEGDHDKTMRVESFILPEIISGDIDLSRSVKIVKPITKTLKNLGVDSAKDIAGIHFDSYDDALIIVSDDSNLIYKIGIDGTLYSVIKMDKVLQMEGVVTTDSGEMIVVSEPNILINLGIQSR